MPHVHSKYTYTTKQYEMRLTGLQKLINTLLSGRSGKRAAEHGAAAFTIMRMDEAIKDSWFAKNISTKMMLLIKFGTTCLYKLR